MLWRVHLPKHPANFLFGTIHVDDKRVKKLNDQVIRRFNESKTLCLEILPDREMQVGIGLAMLLPEKQSLDTILGNRLFSRLSLSLNKLGMDPLQATRLKPWAAMVVLSRPRTRGGYALDEQLYHWGVYQYKQLCALETLQEQLSVFDELSLKDQVALLEDSLRHQGMLHDMNEALIQAYLSGNLDEIYRRSLEVETGNNNLSQRLRDALIDQRNLHMLNRMIPQLKKGRSFIAVGALHLPGKNGLLNLLRQQGFVVTPPSVSVNPWY
ncbi:MAG: TraB/GumN family protein [Bermanella sp.]